MINVTQKVEMSYDSLEEKLESEPRDLQASEESDDGFNGSW